MESKTGLAVGLNKGHITTPLEKKVKPSYRKGVSICSSVLCANLEMVTDENKDDFGSSTHASNIHPS